jgi:SAM-dependent methyltransferase
VSWLDLCCGSGRALAQAADHLGERDSTATLVGIDLVDAFVSVTSSKRLDLMAASVVGWVPPRRFDLITCVHGLHYIGDKLSVISAAASALSDDGLFVADLDPSNIRLPDGRPAGRVLSGALRRAGLTFDSRHRRVRCDGHRDVRLPFTYLGADDRAGPNYTNQPAVNSYYARTATGSRPASRPPRVASPR